MPAVPCIQNYIACGIRKDPPALSLLIPDIVTVCSCIAGAFPAKLKFGGVLNPSLQSCWGCGLTQALSLSREEDLNSWERCHKKKAVAKRGKEKTHYKKKKNSKKGKRILSLDGKTPKIINKLACFPAVMKSGKSRKTAVAVDDLRK